MADAADYTDHMARTEFSREKEKPEVNLKEQIDRLSEVVEKLENILGAVEPKPEYDTPFDEVKARLQKRGQEALKDVMVWTCMSMTELAPILGIHMDYMSRMIHGRGSKGTIKKVLIFRKEYAEKTGREIKEECW